MAAAMKQRCGVFHSLNDWPEGGGVWCGETRSPAGLSLNGLLEIDFRKSQKKTKLSFLRYELNATIFPLPICRSKFLSTGKGLQSASFR